VFQPALGDLTGCRIEHRNLLEARMEITTYNEHSKAGWAMQSSRLCYENVCSNCVLRIEKGSLWDSKAGVVSLSGITESKGATELHSTMTVVKVSSYQG
jgi:hypothetical protein